MEPPKQAQEPDPRDVARMDPRLCSLLTHCGLAFWVPILEAEVPGNVREFEAFARLGEYTLRAVFEELAERLYFEDRLPTAAIDQLIATLYPKEAADTREGPGAPAPTAAAAPAATVLADAEPPSDVPARERYSWDQSSHELYIRLRGLPPHTKSKDVKLDARAKTISLSVNGEDVLKAAPLARLIVSDESDFELQDAPCRSSRILTVTLTKVVMGSGVTWPALLAGE